jgi:hypothetical protein
MWRDSDIQFDAWLSVVDAQGQVIHESWHCSGGSGWLWQGIDVPVPQVVLFVHVRWLLSRNVGSQVVGLFLPQFQAFLAGQ